MPRCYFPKHDNIKLHGFCGASEQAYAGVVYLRMIETKGDIHISLVLAKTRVASIKRLSIPHLELCGSTTSCSDTSSLSGCLETPYRRRFCLD